MFKPVSSKLEMPALEQEMIELWRERSTMARYLARNEASERRWSFLDGPITANNPMGVHHAWGRTYKDLYQRYHTMLGERQRYQNGFDCQGLWIEVEAEKELGFKNKRDIESYGIDRFVEFCKARTQRFADRITEQSIRLGMWMDWDHSYYTNSDENNYAIWAFLAECHRRGLIYRGHDVMPWCPRCGTGLSNMELATEGYRELTHLSLTVRLPITSEGHEDEDLLVWTTTPWTLSSNVAAAVHPELTYVLVEGRDGRRWWLSHGSQPRVAPDATVVREAKGAELVGLTYRGPFDELPAAQGVEHRVITWDEVSDEEGTGIVHIAPGCGQEDFALSKQFDLAVIDPIDEFGRFKEGFGWQSGRYAGADDPDGADLAREVAEDLEGKGLLVAREQYRHSYPVCWRCGTQVVFRLVDEWFIAMDPLRAELADSTRRATWLPPGIGLEERELDWLRNMSDWMISKKRYYGLALPIWTCTDCDAWEVIESRDDAARARRRRLGRVRRPLAASAVGGRRGDRVPVLRWAQPPHHRCRQPVAGRRHRGHLHAEVDHRPRLLAGVVPGRPRDRVLPGPVPQLVLRPDHREHGDDRPGAVHHALQLRPAARRARRGDAQEQGQRHLVRRRGRADRRRRHALDVQRHQPGGEHELRLPPGPRGGAPLLPAGLEHLRLLRHLRAAGRLDAVGCGRDRWAGRGADAAGPLDPVAAGGADRRGARRPRRATTRSGRRGRSRRSWTSCRTGTCDATGAASGRASWTTTSAPPTPPCTGCWST